MATKKAIVKKTATPKVTQKTVKGKAPVKGKAKMTKAPC